MLHVCMSCWVVGRLHTPSCATSCSHTSLHVSIQVLLSGSICCFSMLLFLLFWTLGMQILLPWVCSLSCPWPPSSVVTYIPLHGNILILCCCVGPNPNLACSTLTTYLANWLIWRMTLGDTCHVLNALSSLIMIGLYYYIFEAVALCSCSSLWWLPA